MKRNVEIVVLSDLHLGTYGCHAKEVLDYLKSIRPELLILNGDIIDIWQFNRKYFPKEHLQVIYKILKLATNGTKVYYLTGNHDERLRDFSNLKFANIHLYDQLELDLGGKKHWFFHGDVFDASVNYTKIFAKMGAVGYDSLIRINHFINSWRKYFGLERISFSKRIKYSVKEAVKFIQNFEDLAVTAAIKQDFDVVVCGHIHRPIIKNIVQDGKRITYLNAGDWVENLTALEYNHGKWSIYEYEDDIHEVVNPKLSVGASKAEQRKPEFAFSSIAATATNA
jgi:UDP-2,3-diacylglucosamine pyrophosphatase LpxH